MNILCVTLILACAGYTIAGQGGSAYLINLSGSDWKKTHSHTYQMNHWDFPDILKNGDTVRAYVEFDQGIFKDSSDDSGEVVYELLGTGGKKFTIEVHGDPFRLEVVHYDLVLDGHYQNVRKNIGWKHDGDNDIILIKTSDGKYTGTGLDGSNWMRNNIGWLGQRTLKQISMPGSHDAGMSKMDGSTGFAHECNVITQVRSIHDQLNLGSRYFDIRPVIGNGGKYMTGHYGYVEFLHIYEGYQGANGQSIDSIIDDINAFTKDHNELIIMKLSHSYNTDLGNDNYRKFIQSEWDGLFEKLDRVNNRFYNDNTDVDLTKMTLNDFTKHGSQSAVLFIVDDSGVNLGSRAGQGYYLSKNFNIYDDYANKDNWPAMVNDQIGKMKQHSKDQYFLLSWTLTQVGNEAAFCREHSLEVLARESNFHLGHWLYQEVSDSAFPNIILMDYIQDTDIVELALAINSKVKF